MLLRVKIIANNIIEYRKYKILKKCIRKNETRDSKLSGDVYIISRDGRVGLCSYIITTVGQIYTAVKCGYTPVVDMMNYPNTYLDDNLVHKENMWEYYFEQPEKISLDMAKNDVNVVLSRTEYCLNYPKDTMTYFNNVNNELEKWRKFAKKYLRLNEQTYQYIQNEYKKIIKNEDRVLGVLCRGTDYINLRPKDHPIQPEPSVVINKAEQIMKEYKCDKLFLATEDDEIMKQFIDYFGDIVITNNHKLWKHNSSEYLADIPIEKEESMREIGLNYLTTIVILSKCTCLIGGATSGSVTAMMMSDGYEYSYIWDLGRY